LNLERHLQILEAEWLLCVGKQSQFIKVEFLRYLSKITLCQMPLCINTLQRVLAFKAKIERHQIAETPSSNTLWSGDSFPFDRDGDVDLHYYHATGNVTSFFNLSKDQNEESIPWTSNTQTVLPEQF
jgi:hypothetical protein